MKRLLLLPFFLVNLLLAQEPLTPRTEILPRAESPLTYAFRLSDAQVEEILSEGIDMLSIQELGMPIDSADTSRELEDREPGYYCLTNARNNQESRELVSIYRWQAYVVNNERDLMVGIFDSSGTIIEEAEVKLEGKEIPFDTITQTYRLPRPRREGLLTVTHQGYTDYFQIDARRGPVTLLTIGRRIAWTPPIRWIWRIPYRFVADIVKSFKYYGPQGWVDKVVAPFTYGYWSSRRGSKFQGYLALDKPMHRPRDSVRVKAVLMRRNGKPYDQPLRLSLTQNYGRTQFFIAELQPYAPGAYALSFLPHDSLKLRQGERYQLWLEGHRDTRLLITNFNYQDYELSGTEASFSVSQNTHHSGETVTLSARLYDENNLNLPGARVHLKALSGETYPLADTVFVPNLLWEHEQVLDPIGKTEIVLPDSIFPPANLSYTLRADLLSVDGEAFTETENLTFRYDSCWLQLEERGDSIYGEMIGCENVDRQAILIAYFRSGQSLKQSVELPFVMPIDPQVAAYVLDQGERNTTLEPAQPQVQVAAQRTQDSLFILIQNPRGLPLWYELFEGKKRSVTRGRQQLELAMAVPERKAYFLSVSYLWRGKMEKQEYHLNLEPHRLQVEFEAPDKIYPGQTTELALRVQDHRGDPVADADVLAYAFTSQFDAAAPTVPTIPHKTPQRRSYNSFSRGYSEDAGSTELDYTYWQDRFGLDSLQAYQFLYPADSLFYHVIAAPDSFTQLAAYVVDSGAIEPVLISYVDAKPYYIDAVLNHAGYTQPIDSGWHHIRLLTGEHVITIDSVYVPMGHLLLLSVDQEQCPHSYWQPEGSINETIVSHLSRYLMPVKVFNPLQYAYVQQGARVFPLYHDYQRQFYGTSPFIGPISYGEFSAKVPGSFSLSTNYERNFHYEFQPQLVKMRSQEWNDKQLGLKLQIGTPAY